MLLRETPTARQTRLNREKNPPFVSAAVYVWEWDSETPPKFVRTLIPKKDRSETLEDARPGEARYDPFCNEWNICSEWVDESYEESDWGADEETREELHQGRDERGSNALLATSPDQTILPIPAISTTTSVSSMAGAPAMPSVPRSPSIPTTSPAMPPGEHTLLGDSLTPVPLGEFEKSRLEVLETLTKYYGFLPPRGLPTNVGPLAKLADIKALLAITGTTAVKINSALWATPIGKACIDFGLQLANKEGREPPAAVWDLSPSSSDPLQFSLHLRCIKRVRAGSQLLYMFDFGELATVPWNIAVYTASAALMICCLHSELRDDDIAVELVQSGVPFRTLQKQIGLKVVVPHELPCSATPMIFSDHVFTPGDYEFWKQRSQSILDSKRGRAAVLRGGYVWRLALAAGHGVSEALKGPSGLHHRDHLNFCAWDKDGVEYVDDDLTKDELDLLCGVYQSFTGTFCNMESWNKCRF